MSFRRNIVGAALCAVTIVGVGGSAFAGESTGQGRGTPIGAQQGQTDRVGNVVVLPSECAFSGLDDNDGGTVQPGVVQTPKGAPGSLVAMLCGGSGGGAVKD